MDIGLIAPRRGTGLTTTALLMAAVANERGLSVGVVTHSDAFVMVSTKGEGVLPLTANATLYDRDATDERPTTQRVVIRDGERGADKTYVVMRPCLVAFTRLVDEGTTADGLIVLEDFGRAMSPQDISDLTGIPLVATMPVTAEVYRKTDAGRLFSRVPLSASAAFTPLLS